jgi:hypothetical protein
VTSAVLTYQTPEGETQSLEIQFPEPGVSHQEVLLLVLAQLEHRFSVITSLTVTPEDSKGEVEVEISGFISSGEQDSRRKRQASHSLSFDLGIKGGKGYAGVKYTIKF